ncbi:MAG: RHS repeat-associated core domain-containing protein [Clostridia bacterium]|nr:RHS repeat-associated core domain-containing protein [Clostridia bacterium]
MYNYDISGRVLSLTYTGYAKIATTYDEFDRPNGVTYTFAGEEKSVSFTYGEGGRKGTTVLLSGATVSVQYDDFSREEKVAVGNVYEKEITYLGAGGNRTTTLPASVKYSKNSQTIFNEIYTYDDIGNIKTVTNNGVTTTYFYDTLNQLTRASGSDGTVTKYFYNDGGNINYKVNADGSKTHYVYDSEWKDLLVGFGGQSITYDTIGNPINYLGNTMSWTGRTLDSITKADGTQISYTYDLDGIRTKKTVNGVTTEYFVNGTTILAQKTGNDIIWFIYDSDGQILGFTYNDVPYYYVKNLQGDVIKVVDTNGTVVASYTYDPWGKVTSSTGTMAEINPIRYRGYYYDVETGLYYLNTRYYDPDTCRFINADTTAVLTASPMSMTYKNLYAYCDNNPVVRVDIGGQLWEWIKELYGRNMAIQQQQQAVDTQIRQQYIDAVYDGVTAFWDAYVQSNELAAERKYQQDIAIKNAIEQELSKWQEDPALAGDFTFMAIGNMGAYASYVSFVINPCLGAGVGLLVGLSGAVWSTLRYFEVVD